MNRFWLAAAFLAPITAWAADKPPIIPQRDVDIQYQMASPQPGAPSLLQRMRWSVTTGRLRVDPPTPGLYMIVDYQGHRMQVVKPSDHAVLDMATAGPGLPGAAAGSYIQMGADQVAGLACTNWRTEDAAGQETVLCLTADGVMLRASHGDRVLLQASTVTYGPQDAAAFTAPDGFRHVTADKP
jgi:hypothetical protein